MRKALCRNCTYYIAYYKQLSGSYSRLKIGYCEKNNKQQASLDACENYKSNERKEAIWEEIRLASLDHALKSINEIAQILKEKKNEK